MNNQLLFLLTNRRKFSSPLLSSTTESTLKESADTADCRRFLKLHETESDYYVLAHLALLRLGQSSLASLIPQLDPAATYLISAFKPEFPMFGGGTLIPSGDKPARLALRARHYPHAPFITLRALTPTIALLEEDGYPGIQVRTRLSNGVLGVEWPSDLGIQGDVLPDTAWVTDSQLTIYGRPTRFPHAALDAALGSGRFVDRLTNAAGLAGYRAQLTDAAERNACVTVALVYATWGMNRELFA